MESEITSGARAPWSLRRICLLLFLLGCAVRLAPLLLGVVPRPWLLPETVSEIGRTAHTLAESGRYADAYAVPSGPTAHPAPIWTGVVALLYRLFGFSLAAGVARALLGIASYAGVAAVLPWVAVRSALGRRAGWIAGLAAALLPWMGPAELIGWSANEPLAAVALATLLVGSLHRWRGAPPSLGASVALGVGWGVAFHLMPTLLAVLAALLAFELAWRGLRPGALPVAALLVGAALACAPWAIRNVVALDGPIFVRSNLGLELRLGNHDGAAADMETMDRLEGAALRHPGSNPEEARRVGELGELEYMRGARREALQWIARHPAAFLRLAGQRVGLFWFGRLDGSPRGFGVALLTLVAGLGTWRALPRLGPPERAALLVPLLAFPLVYYIVPYMIRYTVPVRWIVLLLAAAAFAPARAATDLPPPPATSVA